ncbi:MAG: hypothetical protein ACR2J0_00580 [Mycobacteriales bacterium]
MPVEVDVAAGLRGGEVAASVPAAGALLDVGVVLDDRASSNGRYCTFQVNFLDGV